MKQLIFVFLMIASPVCLLAQKIEKKTVDKLTGDTTVTSSTEKVYGKVNFTGKVAEQLRFKLTKVKNQYSLSAIIQSGRTSFIVPAGSKLFIKTTDNQIITLTNTEQQPSSYFSTGMGSDLTIDYAIKKSDLSILRSAGISSVKIETTAQPLEYTITGTNTEKVQALVNLF